MCVNDPALGTWSQDFNPVTCNLLRTPDQVSGQAGTGVLTVEFSAEVTGTGLEFGPWFYVVLNPVFFKKNTLRRSTKSSQNIGVITLSDSAHLIFEVYFVKGFHNSSHCHLLALIIATGLAHKQESQQDGKS